MTSGEAVINAPQSKGDQRIQLPLRVVRFGFSCPSSSRSITASDADEFSEVGFEGVEAEGKSGQWHHRNGLPAEERLVSLREGGLGVRSRFPETPRIPRDGDFLASAPNLAQAIRAVSCVRGF